MLNEPLAQLRAERRRHFHRMIAVGLMAAVMGVCFIVGVAAVGLKWALHQ